MPTRTVILPPAPRSYDLLDQNTVRALIVRALASSAVTKITAEDQVAHDLLDGLGDDDHTQYHTDARALTWLGTRSTTDLPEGSGLYYTDARWQTAWGLKSTSDLPEGTNLYWTDARWQTAWGLKSTSDLPEGSNLYFLDERVDDRVNALLQDVAGKLTWTYDDGANTLTPVITYDSQYFSGTNWTDLTDAGETTLHKHLATMINPGTFPNGAWVMANASTLNIIGTSDSGLTGATGILNLGSTAGAHLSLDTNEIMAKSNATTAGDLHINNEGGSVYIHESVDAAFYVNTSDLVVTAGGAVSMAHTLAVTGAIYAKGNIYQSTSDGSDNQAIGICGGGSLSTSRGGYVIVYGNEHAETGQVTIRGGSAHAGADSILLDDAVTVSGLLSIANLNLTGNIWRGVTNDLIIFSGGSTTNLGGNVVFYGEAHASADDIVFRHDTTTKLMYDASESRWESKIAFVVESTFQATGNSVINGSLMVGTSTVRGLLGVDGATPAITTWQMLCINSDDAYAADKGGTIGFGGKYNSGGSVSSWASIRGLKENATDGNYGGYLAFDTRTHGGSTTERMRISSTGLVTIANALTVPTVNVGDTTCVLTQNVNLQINTEHGYVRIGPLNTSWCHFVTDRASYHMDKAITIVGAATLSSTLGVTGSAVFNSSMSIAGTFDTTRILIAGTETGSVRSYFAPRNAGDTDWDWGAEFGYSITDDRWYFDDKLYVGNSLIVGGLATFSTGAAVGNITGGDDAVLLKFVTSRAWQFEQHGADGSACQLMLRPLYDGKHFYIGSVDGTICFSFLPDDVESTGLFLSNCPVQFNTTLLVTGTFTSRAIQPTTDETYSLGTPSYRWNTVYTKYNNVESTSTIVDTTATGTYTGTSLNLSGDVTLNAVGSDLIFSGSVQDQIKFTAAGDSIFWMRKEANSYAFAVYNGEDSRFVMTVTDDGAATFIGDIVGSGDRIHATGFFQIVNTNTKLVQGDGNALKIQTNSGYVHVGPQNTSWCHFVTDRAQFYFAQPVTVASHLHVIGDLDVTRADGNNGYITIDTTEDAALILNADRDNDNEQGNPYVLFKQDGELIQAIMGLADGNVLPDAAACTGVLANSLVIASKLAATAIQFCNTPTEVGLTLLASGNFGIGTIAPGAPLHVTGNADENLRIASTSTTGNPYISFYQTTTRRSFIEHLDSGDRLLIASEFGSISLDPGLAGVEQERFRVFNYDTTNTAGSPFRGACRATYAALFSLQYSHGTRTGATTFYGRAGNKQHMIMNANFTITVDLEENGQELTMYVQGLTSTRTITWASAATINWADAEDNTVEANKTNVYYFEKIEGELVAYVISTDTLGVLG